MTLKSVVNGSQPYKFLIIEDTVEEQAHLLFRTFVNEGLSSNKEVHILCFDRSPSNIEKDLNLKKNIGLYFHDFFTDCDGWLKENDSIENKKVICEDIFSCVHKSSPDSNGILIIIDSLSSVIISYGFQCVYRQIHQLINQNIVKGDCMRQLVSIIYQETLLNYDSIVVQLKHLATNWLTMTKRKGSRPEKFVVKVEHKKANGKLLRQMEECWLDCHSLLQSRMIEVAKEPANKPEVNDTPLEITTFKLSLNEEEKAARSQLVLPYLKSENSGGGGTIFYEPDENDDWDEEDPDDDLDI